MQTEEPIKQPVAAKTTGLLKVFVGGFFCFCFSCTGQDDDDGVYMAVFVCIT